MDDDDDRPDSDEEQPQTGRVLQDYPEDEVLSREKMTQKTIWLVKIPDFVQQQWSQVTEPGQHLGTIRIYDPPPGQPNAELDMEIIVDLDKSLLEDPTPPSSSFTQSSHTSRPGTPSLSGKGKGKAPTSDDEYDDEGVRRGAKEELSKLALRIQPVPAMSQKGMKFLFFERERGYEYSGRSRVKAEPKIFGMINEQVQLTPRESSADKAVYSRLVRGRYEFEGSSKAKSKMIGQMMDKNSKEYRALHAGKNTRVLGRNGNTVKGQLLGRQFDTKSAPKERYLRLSRADLEAALLETCFREYKYWNIKGLCARLEQPVAWVREVLLGIGTYHSSGPYNGLWGLHERFNRTGNISAQPDKIAPDNVEPRPILPQAAMAVVPVEVLEMEESDEDEDEDDSMEES